MINYVLYCLIAIFVGTGQNDNNLSFRLFFLEVGNHLVETPPHTFLMNLRDLTTDTDLTVAAIYLGKLLQCLDKPIG